MYTSTESTVHAAATAFIYHEERLAFIFHPFFGKWLPPGGHVEENETPQTAAIREALEETGLAIELINPTCFSFNYTNAKTIVSPLYCALEAIPEGPKGAAHEHLDYVFLARVKGCTKLISPEGLKAAWFSKKQILELSSDEIFAETRDACLYIFDQLAGTLL